MNTTKEQLAFNTFWNSMDEHEGMDTEICENVFKAGYNAGRKQALEEAIAICKNSGWNAAGDLMAKQEAEHIMKLAKFGASLIRDGYFEADDALSAGLMDASYKFKPEIQANIEQLLKDKK